MRHINNFLNLFPHADKVLHFVAGFIACLVFHYLFKAEIWTAFGLAMTVGLIKEMVYDFFWKGHVSWLDWFATIAGALLMVWIA